MKSPLLVLFFLCGTTAAKAQINCNTYLWAGDSTAYQACRLYDYALNFPQGSRFSQMLCDRVLAICPRFDEAYMGKAVPYLKRGDFITWRILIDKAVALNPKEHLGYRAWCRYQFLRDYAGALEDLTQLEKIKQPNIGYSANGDYHLIIAKALCYKGLGEKEKAIAVIEKQLSTPGYEPGYYDYLHLGVLKIETGNPQQAIPVLEKERALSVRFAETHYYLAQAYKLLGDRAEMSRHLQEAQSLCQQGQRRQDPYDHPADQIYASDIAYALEHW